MKNLINNRKKIGIIGGMGPDASIELLQKMMNISRSNFGAVNNEDYPRVLLDSLSVKDFVNSKSAIGDGIEKIRESANRLEEMGVDCFGVACNTAHVVLDKNRVVLPGGFVSIIDETVAEVKNRKLTKVGLMGSPVTIKSGVFQKKLSERGVEVILPVNSDVDLLGEVILSILSGKIIDSGKKLEKIATSLVREGAEGIVLACTELPLVFPEKFEVPLVDTLEVLAKALLNKYYLKIKE